MLSDTDAATTIAVSDLQRARDFYEGVLGLPVTGTEGDEVVMLRSGSSTVMVYRSPFAGTNRATAMTWAVDDVPGTVRELEAKGIAFEHYDLPGLRREGHLHLGDDGLVVAWFKDPDGNILCVVNR